MKLSISLIALLSGAAYAQSVDAKAEKVSTKSAKAKSVKAKSATTAKSAKASGGCSDPLKATLDTLQCISDANATCAGAGYNTEEFKKFHNTKDTNTVIDGAGFWAGAFALIKLSFSYDFKMNVGPNMASIRYIEYVDFTNGTSFGLPASSVYPFGFKAIQHEWALVTVDDECKIKTWDQYGDDKEQKDVDDAAAAMVAQLCLLGIFPPEACVPPS